LAARAGLDTADLDPNSTYRRMLQTHGGAASAAKMDAGQRSAVIAHLTQATGAKARPRARTGSPRARLVYHLWRSLSDAGAVRNERGLGAWLRKYTAADSQDGEGWSKPEFVPPDTIAKVIEYLKEWAAREKVEWR
jgi:hypothetical protein